MLIDTGAYKVDDWLDKTKEIGQMLDLEVVVDQGSIAPIEKLLTGDWDQQFLIINPGRVTVQSDFMDF
jgi:hypothetical protein